MYTYTIFTAESAYGPAVNGCFPNIFTKENSKKVPVYSLLISNLIVQAFLIILYVNESTYQIFYTLSTSMMFIPYILSSLFYAKLLFKRDECTKDLTEKQLLVQKFIAILGTAYGVWLLYSSGIVSILISSVLYMPGVILYIWNNRERKQKPFNTTIDKVSFVVIGIMFVISSVLILNGTIKPF